ncbi:hypothetical protein M2323_004438 [Rhodoblastus acidophilus]|uniref:hypothetical protein n=1 Tax=Rhodoblastus acidophilus TaxID=1074 RepID=UPI0022254633|nr:hypothetical protein [Rhodoblastus acidophilus]MCW2286669.1 hypothetical protein [Rhodoblastus acidophilus]MCW2335489.1 hypothetical protein [Rhodoblastus acidophilus]
MQQFTARQYLAIDIANSFGLDKKTWAERLSWFDQHRGHLHEMIQQADEPALFYAGVKAMEAVEKGEPIGYPDDFYVVWAHPKKGGNLGEGVVQLRKTLPGECL